MVKVLNINDNSDEYIIKKFTSINGLIRKYKLYTGNNGWREPNKKILTIIDDGNGYILEWENWQKPLKKNMNYSQAASLFVLMSYIHKQEPFFECKFVKEEILFSI